MFQPDYRYLESAARNVEAARIPLYEHLINFDVIEKIMNKEFAPLIWGNYEEKKEFFRNYCAFFMKLGYDTVSFELCIGGVLPGGGALGGHKKGVIQTREDFEKYPFDEIPELYEKAFHDIFRALHEVMPEGMKAVGGVGNGIFECVQDLTGYMDLCYISADDPELYADLYKKVGDMSLKIWKNFLREFSDDFCVLRFGDDLGFKSNTLISDDDIVTHIIPQYKKIIDEVHRCGKPFLLHSCGNIFNVMNELIAAGIDAKHSNEDQIAPFPVWVEKYGEKIGNFGGIDTDAVCRLSRAEMKEYITDVVKKSVGRGGFAFGSGNSIPSFVPVDNYLMMNEIIREIRGE
ncbi:MAG: uroporphyrinogen decarboxylase family protein [Eubacteriales bacterium]|jgi:uroporphyrinogen decarboxylase